MYQAFENLIVWMVYFGFPSCLSGLRSALCLPTVWEYTIRALVVLGSSLLLGWSVSGFRRHINRVPHWMTSAAVGQIVLITSAFFWSYWKSPGFGAVLVGMCAIWSLRYAGREAQAAINEVRSCGWMQAWRMVEQK